MKQAILEIKVTKFFDDEAEDNINDKDIDLMMNELVNLIFDYIGGDELSIKHTRIDGRVLERIAVMKDGLPEC